MGLNTLSKAIEAGTEAVVIDSQPATAAAVAAHLLTDRHP